jgi:hypothetical protein
MRLYYYIGREKPGSKTQAYLSIAIDRVAGLAGLCVIGAILFTINFGEIERHPQMRSLVLVSAAVAAGLILLSALVVGVDRYISQLFGGLRGIYRIATHRGLLVHHYRHSLPLGDFVSLPIRFRSRPAVSLWGRGRSPICAN